MNDEITQPEATALAHFIHAIRPEWDTAGIIGQLGTARTKAPKTDLAVAAIRAASNRTNRTPAVIGMDGAHWRTPEPYEQATPLPSFPDCPKHPGEKITACKKCRDAKVPKPDNFHELVEQARTTGDTTE